MEGCWPVNVVWATQKYIWDHVKKHMSPTVDVLLNMQFNKIQYKTKEIGKTFPPSRTVMEGSLHMR